MSILEAQRSFGRHPVHGQELEGSSGYQRGEQLTRWLALAGLVGPVMYVLDVTLVGLARPGYSVISQAVSELGGGPDGWQLNFALIALGVLLTSFTVGFFRSLTAWSGQARRWVCAGVLMLPPSVSRWQEFIPCPIRCIGCLVRVLCFSDPFPHSSFPDSGCAASSHGAAWARMRLSPAGSRCCL